MKKLILTASAGILFLLVSCSNKESGGMSEKAKKNLATAQAIAKMFETSDWSKVGDYIATDAVDHASMTGKDIVGLDSIKASFAMYSQMMSNMKNETMKELADDDYVFQWLKESWTVTKDGMGMKAGDKPTMNAIEVSRFKDGKVVEHWSFIDMNDMMKMMPPPPMENKMDTAKMKEPMKKK